MGFREALMTMTSRLILLALGVMARTSIKGNCGSVRASSVLQYSDKS